MKSGRKNKVVQTIGCANTFAEEEILLYKARTELERLQGLQYLFVDHDDATRALMGSHMQTQAVPLIAPESPYVGTGMEATVATAMKRTILAKHSGKVTYVDGSKIIVALDKKATEAGCESSEISADGKTQTYNLTKFLRINTYDQPGVEGGKIILKGMLKNK